MHAPLSWKVERAGGCRGSITQTSLVSAGAGSGTLQAQVRRLWQVGHRSPVNSLDCTPSSARWIPAIRTKASFLHLNFVPKRRDVLCYHTECHMWITFLKMAIGQNFQHEDRALFPVFIYLYNICTDFLLKMKDELTSGMLENIEVILLLVLVFGEFLK